MYEGIKQTTRKSTKKLSPENGTIGRTLSRTVFNSVAKEALDAAGGLPVVGELDSGCINEELSIACGKALPAIRGHQIQ